MNGILFKSDNDIVHGLRLIAFKLDISGLFLILSVKGDINSFI